LARQNPFFICGVVGDPPPLTSSPEAYLACVPNKGNMFFKKPGKKHGFCGPCDSTCTPGKCVERYPNSCTACPKEIHLLRHSGIFDDNKEWSNGHMESTGDGRVHGRWGNNVKSVEKTFKLPEKHTRVEIKARYWAIDSWDNEWGFMDVDGQQVWKARTDAHHCRNGFQAYSGSFPNPWGGNRPGHKCYFDIDVKRPHTGSTLKLRFRTSINQHKNDESWAFNRVQIRTNGQSSAIQGLCLKCASVPAPFKGNVIDMDRAKFDRLCANEELGLGASKNF